MTAITGQWKLVFERYGHVCDKHADQMWVVTYERVVDDVPYGAIDAEAFTLEEAHEKALKTIAEWNSRRRSE